MPKEYCGPQLKDTLHSMRPRGHIALTLTKQHMKKNEQNARPLPSYTKLCHPTMANLSTQATCRMPVNTADH